jgi:hypothetical protein
MKEGGSLATGVTAGSSTAAVRVRLAGSIQACDSMEETQMKRKQLDVLLIPSVGIIVGAWAVLRVDEHLG